MRIFKIAYCPCCGNENLKITENNNVYCFNCSEERYIDKLGYRLASDNEKIIYNYNKTIDK